MPKSAAPLPRDGRNGPVRVVRPAPEAAPEAAPAPAPTVTLTEDALAALIASAVAATKERKAPRTAAPAPVAWSESDRSLLALIGWNGCRWLDCVQHTRKPASDAPLRSAGLRETVDSVFHRAIYAALTAGNGGIPAPALARVIKATENVLGRPMKRTPRPETITTIMAAVYGREAYFLRGVLTVPSLFKP